MTRAVDTNVLVRWITRDDPEQATVADAVFAADVVIPLTVLMETGWVLKGTYGLGRADIADLLNRVVATRTVTLDHEAGVRRALDRYRAGADLADMIHLLAASGADVFATFDRQLAPHAGTDEPVAVETLG